MGSSKVVPMGSGMDYSSFTFSYTCSLEGS
jgi:hypothetical protein